MEKIQLIATAAFGLEAVVAREVKALGYDKVTVENGKVTFESDPLGIVRANLWLRSADRVLLKIGSFKATTFDELFEKTKALQWSQWIPKDGEFPVNGKSINSKLFSVPDCQAIVKKAVVESLKKDYKVSWFEEKQGMYKIEVALLKDEATLTLDTSGAGLHKRGYRSLTSQAPIKETLAAAIIQLSFWNHDRALIDPMCGSGTILIEAGLIGKNIAPGIYRNFAAEEWTTLKKALWNEGRMEAHDLEKKDRKLRIQGSDVDEEALSLARYHISEAFLDEDIHVQKRDVGDISSRYEYGCIITNPPYGERLSDKKEVERLYKKMGRTFEKFPSWSKYIITSKEDFEKYYGKKADKKRKLYNGRIKTDLYQYFGPRPPRTENREK